VTEEIEKVL
jgi:coiled-coil domain-containing protein 77